MKHLAASGAGHTVPTPFRWSAGNPNLGVTCADYCQAAVHDPKVAQRPREVVKRNVGGRRWGTADPRLKTYGTTKSWLAFPSRLRSSGMQ